MIKMNYAVYDGILKAFAEKHRLKLGINSKEDIEVRSFWIPNLSPYGLTWQIWLDPADENNQTTVYVRRQWGGKNDDVPPICFDANPNTLTEVLELALQIVKTANM